MQAKNVSMIVMLIVGSALAVYGFISANAAYINLGIAGMFLAAVVYTFKPVGYIKKVTIELLLKDYEKITKRFFENLALEGSVVVIPPYENLPEGGIFIPLCRDFRLDIGRLDENIVFLTEVPEKAMGLFLGPLGSEFVKKFEEHLEKSLAGSGVNTVEIVSGAVFNSLGLAKGVYIKESNGKLRVVLLPTVSAGWSLCQNFPSPTCASLLLALAKATGEVLMVEKVVVNENAVELQIKRLGGVREWM